jgi:hypothetical protein
MCGMCIKEFFGDVQSIGYSRAGAVPDYHFLVLPWCPGYHLRSVAPSMSVQPDLDDGTVYDVSNRESFDALPRWYSELETYVSGSVVKILVGNKVDKVCCRPLIISFPNIFKVCFFIHDSYPSIPISRSSPVKSPPLKVKLSRRGWTPYSSKHPQRPRSVYKRHSKRS